MSAIINKLSAVLLPLIAVLIVVAMILFVALKVWTWAAKHLEPEKQNIELIERGIFDL